MAYCNRHFDDLSPDRLKRYMSKAHPAPTIPPSAPEPDFGQEKCGLFSDIAVKFEQGWVLGTVERMMRYYGKGRTKGVEYKFPVNLEDRKVNVLQFFYLVAYHVRE